VVVLLSGGRDSTCLLDVCVQLGADASALHVNYGLRAEADAEEEHCRSLCRRLEVELDVEHPGNIEGNTQAWARDVRYAAGALFARARVREGLVPALRAVDARAEANILRTAALLRDEAEVLDAVVTTALAGRDRISVEHLRELPPALGRLVVRRLAENALGAPVPRAVARFEDVLALDGALDVGDGARAVVERGVLHFERTP